MDKKLVLWMVGPAAVLLWLGSCGDMATQMSGAERLYRAKCSSCHNIIARGSHSEPSWRAYIDKYGRAMTENEKRTILQYVAPAHRPKLPLID
jgi:hypothetical protein